eukprot:748661-Hanusia_phi.AAC.1
MSHPRAMCAAAVWDGMIYVSGGKARRQHCTQDRGGVEEGKRETGSQRGKNEEVKSEKDVKEEEEEGQEEQEEYVSVVERYDPQDDKWTVLSPLLLPRALHKMVVLPTNRGLRLCAIGGFTVSSSLPCLFPSICLAVSWVKMILHVQDHDDVGEHQKEGEGEKVTCLSSSEYYDRDKDAWEECGELELPYPCAGFDITTV